MPVNFQQALEQIREMGREAPQHEEHIIRLRADAGALLEQYGNELDSLEQLVERAAVTNPHLRCAAPFCEALHLTHPAPPANPCFTLLAADGSQINPDRHASVEFGAINVGAIRVQPGMGFPPQERVSSRLMFYKDLYTEGGSPLTDDVVALMRDMAERQELVDLAQREPAPVVTLTDGPLELFREGKGMPGFDEQFAEYLKVLEKLADMGAATAGYVDKPRGDLAVRLLELCRLHSEGRMSEAGKYHPFLWMTDADLFLQRLKPGERSAVFAIHSGATQAFKGRLSLHFFYLNVGRPGHAYLSRVEIPRWVAESGELLDLLHAALLGQAHQLGARPYPYILHRAHEIAVVTFNERDQLENMIVAELRRQGVTVGDRSNKQWAKDSSNS